MKTPDQVGFLNLTLACIDGNELNEFISSAISETDIKSPLWIGNYNVHAVNIATSSPNSLAMFESSTFNFCDSQGLALSLRFIRGYKNITPLPYNEWMEGMIETVSKRGGKFYFLGDEKKVIAMANEKANTNGKSICVGFRDGFFDLDDTENISNIIDDINCSGADVLIVGMGMPRQEQFIQMTRNALNVKVILNGGACFKFYTDSVAKCPVFISKIGLEWLFRMILEPGRLWKRYLVGNFSFLRKLLFS